MFKLTARLLAATLAVLLPPAAAAELCDGPCAIDLQFETGGRIDASDGATLTFGEGGSLAIGDFGHIEFGDGGSATPANLDMSQGGTIVLGPGGYIEFGLGGALASGEQGGVSLIDGGSLHAQGLRNASVETDGAVHFGVATITSCDSSVLLASGDGITENDAGTPVHFTLGEATYADGGPSHTPTLFVGAGGGITLDHVANAAPVCDSGGGGSGSGDGGSAGGFSIGHGEYSEYHSYGSDGSLSIENTGSIDAGSASAMQLDSTPSSSGDAGGAMSAWGWLVLGLLGALRPRRP